MSSDSARELGRLLAGNANETQNLKEDLLPDAVDQNFLLAPTDRITLAVAVTGIQWLYPTDSFIIDHPTYGELDSSTLKLDGGYADTIIGNQFPLNFSDNAGLGWSFSETSTMGSTLLFTYNS